MASFVISVNSGAMFRPGDSVYIYRAGDRPFPRWVGRWAQDMDIQIIRWAYSLVGVTFPATSIIRTISGTTLEMS